MSQGRVRAHSPESERNVNVHITKVCGIVVVDRVLKCLHILGLELRSRTKSGWVI